MWSYFTAKKSRDVFVVQAHVSKAVIGTFASSEDAIVFASRTEILEGSKTLISRHTMLGARRVEIKSVDLGRRIPLESLTNDLQAAVLQVKNAQLLAMTAVAKTIESQWTSLLFDYRQKETRCNAAKKAIQESYVRDRSTTNAKVREVYDANDSIMKIAYKAICERGEQLVSASKEKDGISLKDLLEAKLLLDPMNPE